MSEFIIGQRWVSHTETNLGLGIIVGVEGRQIKISFPAIGEERIYAMDSAPLARIEHKPGETISNNDGLVIKITETHVEQGRLIYAGTDEQGNRHEIDEIDLDNVIELTTPKQRLLSGQLEHPRNYQLRCATLQQIDKLQQSPVNGLLGSRTNLLPHQTYIAYEVAKRFAPRVLLADEVGLGKTIEAGMIMHYQLHTGLASRILIIVPDTLTHQWLVEMLRRFNLRFALFNQDRIEGLREAETGNPFDSEQLVICSLSDITTDPKLFDDANQANWDMIVVDEAHHLHWSEEEAGHDYRCIETLAKQTSGLLLLTATPEQVGMESHFARLRLLDPARFHDLQAFKEEEKDYRQLSEIVSDLLDDISAPVKQNTLDSISKYLGEEALTTTSPDQSQRETIVNQLLDQHGTGRVFLRNTREAIKGFPERKLIDTKLTMPEMYQSINNQQGLFPEHYCEDQDWFKSDPRVEHLINLIKELGDEKVLVICAHAETTISLEKYLQLRVGIRTAAFYEDLSIIERDRAAAYFAEPELGAQILICSEIGSEGRNFQFAHHLFLFDLPLNPDLLEQRIGRLDRIGQTEDIKIHVPYLENSAQQVLFRWYNEGLNIFEESCAAGFSIYENYASQLDQAINDPSTNIDELIVQTRKEKEHVKTAMQAGRDRLIELNSCRPAVANKIIEQIKQHEQAQELMDYMESMFDGYGVDHEEHSDHTWILHPSDHMRLGYFPGLGDESITVTFDREKALSREDFTFVSWEHPMVSESMEMVMNSEIGNAVVTTLEMEGIQPGTILLESYACLTSIAPKHLQIGRYLPLSPLRTLISQDKKNYAKALSHDKLNQLCMKVDKKTALAIVKQIKKELAAMIDFAQRFTDASLEKCQKEAIAAAEKQLGEEINRLKVLKQNNATIRDDEINFLEEQLHACKSVIQQAKYEIQALRLVIVQ